MHIKNYLHFHLGCQVLFHNIDETKTLTPELLFELQGYEDHVKPILIPVSQVDLEKEPELNDLLEKYDVDTDDEDADALLALKGMATLTQQLLSKNVDIFGLIEAGLAIDINTLPSSTS